MKKVIERSCERNQHDGTKVYGYQYEEFVRVVHFVNDIV